jgi:hypothetical protein
MTPAELRARAHGAITPTSDEVADVYKALLTMAATQADSGQLWMSFAVGSYHSIIHAARKANHPDGNPVPLRYSASINALALALDRMRDEGFTVEVRYPSGTTLNRLPQNGPPGTGGVGQDTTVTVSWTD